MGGFKNVFRGGRKSSSHIRQHNRDLKIREFEYINEHYGLGLDWNTLNDVAWAYGDAAATRIRKKRQNFLKNAAGFIVAFTGGFIFGGFLLAGATLLLTYTNIILANRIERKLESNAAKIKNLQTSITTKNLQEQQKTYNNQLTQNLLLYYADIFPKGRIWNAQSPGSETYSPSIEYFAAKGIVGNLNKDTNDEFLMNRGHYEQAGNEGYLNFLPLPQTPKKEFFQIYKQAKMQLMIEKQKVYEKGFLHLFEAEFGTYLTSTDPNKLAHQRLRELLQPYSASIFTFDFLQKITHYAKAEPANFSFLWEKQINPYFKPFKDNKSQNSSGLRRIFKKRI